MRKQKLLIQSLLIFSIPALIAFGFFWEKEEKEASAAEMKSTDGIPVVVDPELEAFIHHFETQLDSAFQKYGIPGAAVSIVIDSTYNYVKTFGVKSIGGSDSIDQNSMFRIASVSKGFAGILAGNLVEGTNVNWSDPISRYIPDFNVRPDRFKDSITIEHILSHTSGYPYQAYSTLIEDGIERDRLFKELQNIKLSRKPGDIYSYQNVAYALIEPVLEHHYDTTFNTIITEKIFKPLGMENASISYKTMSGSTNRAQPHSLRKTQFVPIPFSPAYYNVAAAGGINASITDMTKWMRALLGQKPEVVSTSVLNDVFTPRVRTSVKNYSFSNFDRPRKGHYGLGWRIVEYPNDTLIYHGGYANGFKSELALDRRENVAICILTNAPSQFCNIMVVAFFKEYKKFQKHRLLKQLAPKGDKKILGKPNQFGEEKYIKK